MTQICTNFSSARELIGKSNSPRKNNSTVLSFDDVQEEMRSIFTTLDNVLRSITRPQDVSFSNNNYKYFIDSNQNQFSYMPYQPDSDGYEVSYTRTKKGGSYEYQIIDESRNFTKPPYSLTMRTIDSEDEQAGYERRFDGINLNIGDEVIEATYLDEDTRKLRQEVLTKNQHIKSKSP